MLAFASLDDPQQEAIRWGLETHQRILLDSLATAMSSIRYNPPLGDGTSKAAQLESLALYYDAHPKKLANLVTAHRKSQKVEINALADTFATGLELERLGNLNDTHEEKSRVR